MKYDIKYIVFSQLNEFSIYFSMFNSRMEVNSIVSILRGVGEGE